MERREQEREEGEEGGDGERRELVLMEDLTKDPQHHLWVDIVSLT